MRLTRRRLISARPDALPVALALVGSVLRGRVAWGGAFGCFPLCRGVLLAFFLFFPGIEAVGGFVETLGKDCQRRFDGLGKGFFQ